MVRFWTTGLFNTTLHVHKGLENTKSTLMQIAQLVMVQIKTAIVSFTNTCITVLQHISVNLLNINWQNDIPLTKIHSICHHKLFPQSRDTAKLRNLIGTSYVATYIADLGPTQERGLLQDVHCTGEPSPIAQITHVKIPQSFHQNWNVQNQTQTQWFNRVIQFRVSHVAYLLTGSSKG